MIIDAQSDKLLAKKGLSFEKFYALCQEPPQLCLELLQLQGLELDFIEGKYFYRTKFTAIKDSTFCIVDIETNGSDPKKHQIIEIGAIKIQNNKIVDTFESLVQCETISKHITALTGIDVKQTLNAPPLKSVMQKFHQFLGSSVFLAHDVKFDYFYISAMFEQVGLPKLLNRKMCTIALAERSFSSYKYGLSYLNESLKLYNEATHHRALSDAKTTKRLFIYSLKHLPKKIQYTEELIQFSQEASRLKRPKFDPFIVEKKKEEKD